MTEIQILRVKSALLKCATAGDSNAVLDALDAWWRKHVLFFGTERSVSDREALSIAEKPEAYLRHVEAAVVVLFKLGEIMMEKKAITREDVTQDTDRSRGIVKRDRYTVHTLIDPDW